MQRSNAFATAKGDKTAMTMRPHSKLPWTLVVVIIIIITIQKSRSTHRNEWSIIYHTYFSKVARSVTTI